MTTINEFLNQSLSMFKKHIEYTEQFEMEFEELYQIGQNLQSAMQNYAELVRSNRSGKEIASGSVRDE